MLLCLLGLSQLALVLLSFRRRCRFCCGFPGGRASSRRCRLHAAGTSPPAAGRVAAQLSWVTPGIFRRSKTCAFSQALRADTADRAEIIDSLEATVRFAHLRNLVSGCRPAAGNLLQFFRAVEFQLMGWSEGFRVASAARPNTRNNRNSPAAVWQKKARPARKGRRSWLRGRNTSRAVQIDYN